MNRRQKFHADFLPEFGQRFANRHRLIRPLQGDRHNRHVQFAAQNRKRFFEFRHLPVAAARAFRENHQIFAASQRGGHRLQRVLQLPPHVNDNHVVFGREPLLPPFPKMLLFGVKIGALQQLNLEKIADDNGVKIALMIDDENHRRFRQTRKMVESAAAQAEIAAHQHVQNAAADDVKQRACRQRDLRVFMQQLMPIDAVVNHFDLLFRDMRGNLLDGQMAKPLFILNLHAERGLQKGQQADFIKRIEAEIHFEQIAGRDRFAGLIFQERGDHLVFGQIRLSLRRARGRGAFRQIGKLKPLDFA